MTSPFAVLSSANAARAGADLDEIEVALLIDGLIQPNSNAEQTRETLHQVAQSTLTYADPWSALATLGFKGNSQQYHLAENSSLSWVLQNRRGIPISLAIVLIACARAAGWRAVGLNNPGHFLVRLETDDDPTPLVVDPFVMQPAAVTAEVASTAIVSGPRELALRMLNNLKQGHAQQAQWHLVLDLVDHQRAILPEAPDLELEQAALWERMGSAESALHIYAGLLSRYTEGPIFQQARQRQQVLQQRKPPTIH